MRPIRSPENSSANAAKFPGEVEETEIEQKITKDTKTEFFTEGFDLSSAER
jgi:hypothetical protein